MQTAFLERLQGSCNIAAALRGVGMSRSGLEKLRARDGGFRARMREVRKRAYLDLEFFALEKMMAGTVKTVTKADGAIETVHEYPLHLALQLLRLHRDAAHGGAEPEAATEPSEEERQDVVERLMRKMRALRARMDEEEAEARAAAGNGGTNEPGAPGRAAEGGAEPGQ